MSWGFSSRNKKAIALHKTMGRIINGSFSARDVCQNIAQSDEKRGESRIKRSCPVVVFNTDARDGKISATVGFSVDMVLDGMAIHSTRRIASGSSIIAIGDANSRDLLAAECIQCSQKEFGCFFSRFRLTETLNQNDHVMLLQILDQLEKTCVSHSC